MTHAPVGYPSLMLLSAQQIHWFSRVNLCGAAALVCACWEHRLVRTSPGRVRTTLQELWLHIHAGTPANGDHLKQHHIFSWLQRSFLKQRDPGVVVHACNPSIWESGRRVTKQNKILDYWRTKRPVMYHSKVSHCRFAFWVTGYWLFPLLKMWSTRQLYS